MKARVHVGLKRSVLDPQGKAVKNALLSLGFSGVEDVRQDKVFEIHLGNNADGENREKMLDEMCRKLLVNPVIEDYQVEWIKDS
jgi:phosphoribosylformylglycinamidine synthase subunit PurS